MMIAARNAFLMGAKLPYDAEVEYIESTGTQWIDTGILPTPTTRIDLDFVPQNNGVRLFGADDNRGGVSRRFWIAVGGNGTNLQYNASTNGTSIMASNGGASIFGVRTAIVAAGKALTAFGTTQTDSSWTIATDNGCSVGLFAGHRILADVSEIWFAAASMRLYSCAIYSGETLVRDFIPVRVGSGANAVGYLYDRANPDGGPLGNGLYGNAADGQGGKAGFPANCVGPDK